MNYYKAREVSELPKLVFDLVAGSLVELIELGLENDPSVVSEDNLPDYQYGICLKDLNPEGVIIDRDIRDINKQQSLYEATEADNVIAKLYDELKSIELSIQVETRLNNDTTQLESDFDAKRIEYQNAVNS